MMLGFPIALQFLTVIPVRIRAAFGGPELARAMAWFPVVGALLGLLAAGVLVGWTRFVGPGAAAAVAVAVLAVVTGGLHLDGVADLADALGSHKSREEKLRIMDDSRIGAMGAATVALVLILKVALIASLPRSIAWTALVAMAAASRCAMLVPAVAFPYARREGGTAAPFVEYLGPVTVAVAVALTAALAGGLFHVAGLVATTVVLVAAWLAGAVAARALGGITGDVLGAVNELGELVWLAALPAALRMMA
ncbi:MAG: adenosylcobinamide-GDP ribazoletransferase [Candidatus Coatesbacteria bacterium]